MKKAYRISFLVSYAKVKEAFGLKTFKACEKAIEDNYGDLINAIAKSGSSAMIIWDDSQPDMRCHKYGIRYHLTVVNEGDARRIQDAMWDVIEDDVEIKEI